MPGTRSSAAWPGTRNPTCAGANSGAIPTASQMPSTTPLASKKSTFRDGADQCGASAAPDQTNATARPSPSLVKRLPASNSRMSFRSRRRLWAQASTSPGRSDGLSTANFSDNGLAMAAASVCGSRKGVLASFSRNANVADSEKPAAVSTCRTRRSRPSWAGGGGLRRRQRGEGDRQPVEPKMTTDLFDEIGLARDIDAERRDRDLPARVLGHGFTLDREAKRAENPLDVGGGDVLAEQPNDPRGPEPDRPRRTWRRVDVDECSQRSTGADRLKERRRAGDAERGRADVAAAFEANRRFGLEPELLAGPADRRRVEVRALEHDAPRRRADFRIVAAHDAAHGAGSFAVGNHEHVRLERAVDAVERPKPLACACPPHHDLPPGEPVVDRRHASADRARAARSW